MTPAVFNELFLKATNSQFRTRWAHGSCYMYAYCFLSIMGGKAVTWMPKDKNKGGHVFIKFDELYFDAETFTGTAKWKKLQRYMNKSSDRLITRHRTLSGMAGYWFKDNHKELSECQEIIKKIKSLV
jgi:hypothetical protein